jgi:hypothetical protein
MIEAGFRKKTVTLSLSQGPGTQSRHAGWQAGVIGKAGRCPWELNSHDTGIGLGAVTDKGYCQQKVKQGASVNSGYRREKTDIAMYSDIS